MKIQSFKGIHNTLPRQELAPNDCADAVDVDISGKGEEYERSAVIRRNGYVQSIVVPIDSSYTARERISYCVSGGYLNRIREDLSFQPLTYSTATEYCDANGVLFTNDAKMVIGDSVTDLYVPQPKIPPQVILTAGSREPGFYTCAYTYTNADGLEGGLSPITFVELTAKGDVLVTPVELPGYTATIYVAAEDGSVFFDVRGVPIIPECIGTAEIPDSIAALEIMDGKLFVVQQFDDYSIIRYSKPFHYHLFDYEKDFIIVVDQVHYIRATGSNLLIGATTGIYVYNDGGLAKVANYGAVPGRSIVRQADDSLLIHTVRGVCAALPFTELTENRVSLPMGQKCSAALVYQNGITKYIGLHDGGGSAFNAEF